MLNQVTHILTDSEIKYGVLTVRFKDDTYDLISRLPPKFEMFVKGKKMKKPRKKGHKNIWMGFSIMAAFKPKYTATLTIKNNSLYLD